MQDAFTSNHFTDSNGRPAGGSTFGRGFAISWQNGPLGRGVERSEPNGAFVETLIAAAHDRINFYQTVGGFPCDENARALQCLESALAALGERTARREAAGTEGTHAGS